MQNISRGLKFTFLKPIKFVVLATLLLSQMGWSQERLSLQKIIVPKNNLQNDAKILLGKTLFFDPRLSKDGTVSCNSCHNVMSGGEDNRAFSAGVGGQLGGRSAPTVWNAALMSVQFWDGRAASLEEQAKGPLINPVEMAMPNHEAVMARLKRIPGYFSLFEKAFGKKEEWTIDHVAMAIASFERTLITPNSKFDRYLAGQKSALSEAELKGYELVKTTGCLGCHSGANFAGPKMPEGAGFYMKFPTIAGTEYEKKYNLLKDLGRYESTKSEADKNMWRVPTWRNITLTAPYFHNGSVPTLEEAIRVMAKTQLNKDLAEQDVKNIAAFLGTLTGERPQLTLPKLPETPGFTITID